MTSMFFCPCFTVAGTYANSRRGNAHGSVVGEITIAAECTGTCGPTTTVQELFRTHSARQILLEYEAFVVVARSCWSCCRCWPLVVKIAIRLETTNNLGRVEPPDRFRSWHIPR